MRKVYKVSKKIKLLPKRLFTFQRAQRREQRITSQRIKVLRAIGRELKKVKYSQKKHAFQSVLQH